LERPRSPALSMIAEAMPASASFLAQRLARLLPPAGALEEEHHRIGPAGGTCRLDDRNV